MPGVPGAAASDQAATVLRVTACASRGKDRPATLDDRCDEIFHTQVAGLAKRLTAARKAFLDVVAFGWSASLASSRVSSSV